MVIIQNILHSKFYQRPFWHKLAWLVLVLGAVLRVVVWWQQRSIFLDEANLIRNWIEKSYLELWGHLAYEQYAPPLYSMLNKIVISIFGVSELTVRFIPLVFGILTLYIFYKIGQRYLSPFALFLASTFIAWSHLFIQYATECKQYSSDGFVAMALVYLAVQHYASYFSWKKALLWLMLGSVAIWFSMPSVFVLAGVGLLFFWKNKSDKKLLFRVIMVAFFWVLQFAAYFFFVLRSEAESDYLQDFHATYFLAFPPTTLEELQRLGVQLADLGTLAIGKTVVGLSLTVVGLYAAMSVFFKEKKELLFLFCFPVLSTLTASALGYYSLIGRLVLFLIPLLILWVFVGMDVLFSLKKTKLSLLLAALFLVPIKNKQQLPAFFQAFSTGSAEVKTGLDFIQQEIQADEVLFAYHNVVPVVRYYTEHSDEKLHFETMELQQYRCCDADIIQQDLNALIHAGEKRIWLLYDRSEFTFLLDFVEDAGGHIEQQQTFQNGVALMAVFP